MGPENALFCHTKRTDEINYSCFATPNAPRSQTHVHLHRRSTLHDVSHDDDDVEILSDRLLSYDGPEWLHLDPSVGIIVILGRGRARSMS